jgi:hypothetical protein
MPFRSDLPRGFSLNFAMPAAATAAILAFTIFAPAAYAAQTADRTAAQASDQTTAARPTAPLVVERVDETRLATLAGNTRPEARAKNDRGAVSPDLPMPGMILVLRRGAKQQAAFDAFVDSQYQEGSPNFHQWLSPNEIGQKYGPAQSDIDAVTNWLLNHNFTVDEVSNDHLNIRFSGSASQVQAAFHTEIHSLQVTDKKGNVQNHIANMSDPQIPAALAPLVVGVEALHNFFPRPLHKLGALTQKSPDKGWTHVAKQRDPLAKAGDPVDPNSSVRPQFTINDPNVGLIEDITPYDFAAIYNVTPLWTAATPITGAGQTIAIVGTSDVNPSDIATFRKSFGLPAYSALTGSTPGLKIVHPTGSSDPGDCSTAASTCIDDLIENSLDVEWAGAIAKNASILLVSSTTGSGTTYSSDPVYIGANYIVNNKLAPIVNVSYGECELGLGTAGNAGYNTMWQNAAAEGIAVFVSSGDSGAASCDGGGSAQYGTPYAAEFGLSVSGLASTPYNTAVGGTDFNWCTPANIFDGTCTAAPYWNSSNSSTTQASALGYIPEVPWNQTCVTPFGIYVNQYWANQIPVTAPTTAEQSCNFDVDYYQEIYQGTGDEVDVSTLVDTVGGSGGKSNCTTNDMSTVASCTGGYAKPSWQTGVTGIPSDGKRDLPDVSFFASDEFLNSAYLICVSADAACTYTDSAEPIYQEVGGTSVASPIMASVMALINQKTGSSQGLPNAELYKLASKQTYSSCKAESVKSSSSCIFQDIDTGTIAMPCDYSDGSPDCNVSTSSDEVGILIGYSATTGFDLATGLGSANVANLVNNYIGSVTTAPAVTLSPTTITFASTAEGVSATSQVVTLKNSGTATLDIATIAISGTNATSFSIASKTCSTTLAAAASCTVTVGFKPTATGALTASLNFTDNATGSPQAVSLNGTGAATPTVTLSPTSLTFASTLEGVAATSQVVTLKNTGTGSLSNTTIAISGTNATSFSIASKTCSTTLAAAASCTVTVGFKPAATGALTASLSFTDNATGSPQAVTLKGTGTEPAATFTPTSLAFPSTIEGVAATSKAVTLKNSGTATMSISAIAISGTNASSFSIASKTCGTTLAVNGTCTVTVGFKPAAVGALTATLGFTDNGTGSPQKVAITGTGAAVPKFTVSPASLTFPPTATGDKSPIQTVTVKNTGASAATISTISLTGTNPTSFIQTHTCTTTLAAGASCTISVHASPTVAGSLKASLSIADDATGSPQTVALAVTSGPAPTVTLTPAALTFGSTTVGSTSGYQTVAVENTGTTTFYITSLGLTGTAAASFKLTTSCTTALAPGATCNLHVAFAPTATGAVKAAVTIVANNPTVTKTVNLTGTGK